MTVDRIARKQLRDAVVAHMNGTIGTYDFDDYNSECGGSGDDGVREISRWLYRIHDDTVDHPISVSSEGWEVLRRVVAFLETDSEIHRNAERATWPFADESQLARHGPNVRQVSMPTYNPLIHATPIHPGWDRIPSWFGVAMIVLAIVVMFRFVLT